MTTDRPEKRLKALRLLATAIFFLIIYNLLTTLFPPYYRLNITLSSDLERRGQGLSLERVANAKIALQKPVYLIKQDNYNCTACEIF